MARRRRRPRPTQAKTLTPVATRCPECGHALWATHSKYRTVTTLDAVTRLTLRVRRCPNPDCPRYRRPCRPEAEALIALPHHEFGLDVLALVGRLRHAEHRSIPEIHQELMRRGVAIALRSVSNLLDRHDEPRAAACPPVQATPRGVGHRRPAARRRPRGLVGAAGLSFRRDPAGAQPPLGYHPGPEGADNRGTPGLARAHHRRHLRWSGQHPQSDRLGLARGAAPTVPLPLSA